jgi:hypothetical protein
VRHLSITMILLAGLVVASAANATVVKQVNLDFQSGATFSGTVTFTNGFTSVTGVHGVLDGYQYGHAGYRGSGADAITWVWAPGTDFATGSHTYLNYLMDGTNSSNYSNWLQFGYSYNASGISLFSGGLGVLGNVNNVDYTDRLISGTIRNVAEPATLSMVGIALLVLGLALRRRQTA